MPEEPKNPYGTIYLGNGEVTKEPVMFGPMVDDLSHFHPLGWYWTTRKRKHWYSIRKTNVTYWGEFKHEA